MIMLNKKYFIVIVIVIISSGMNMCYIDTHNIMKSVCFSKRLIKHCEYNDCFASKPHNFFSKTDLIIVSILSASMCQNLSQIQGSEIC